VKKFTFKQGYLAQRRRGAESTKKIKQLFNSNLCASASLREIVNFFTRSRNHFPNQKRYQVPFPSASHDPSHPRHRPSLSLRHLRFQGMSSAILNACERTESLADERVPTKSVSCDLRTLARSSQKIQLGCFSPSWGPTATCVPSSRPCVEMGAQTAEKDGDFQSPVSVSPILADARLGWASRKTGDGGVPPCPSKPQ
jgi:hypothetical protein